MGNEKKKLDLILPGQAHNQLDKDMHSKQNELNKAYNNRLYNKVIDPKYSEDEITILSGNVLIRLFKEPYFKNEELGIVNLSTFAVPSPSGHKMLSKQDPLPYENRGMIINFDPELKDRVHFKVGDYVQIRETIAQTKVRGEHMVIDNMFHLTEATEYEGYVLIPARDIVCILKNLKSK